jgi:hypothetical protein
MKLTTTLQRIKGALVDREFKIAELEDRLGLAVAALRHVDDKIGHFAKAPHDDELAVVSLIGDLARNVKETLAQIEEKT